MTSKNELTSLKLEAEQDVRSCWFPVLGAVVECGLSVLREKSGKQRRSRRDVRELCWRQTESSSACPTGIRQGRNKQSPILEQMFLVWLALDHSTPEAEISGTYSQLRRNILQPPSTNRSFNCSCPSPLSLLFSHLPSFSLSSFPSSLAFTSTIRLVNIFCLLSRLASQPLPCSFGSPFNAREVTRRSVLCL